MADEFDYVSVPVEVIKTLQCVEWQPIETAPLNKRVLFWWRPIDGNPHAEACIIGEVSAYEKGKWWNGDRGEYQDLWHLTHWMPLPAKPGATLSGTNLSADR